MKKVMCRCGAEFQTHTEEEMMEIVNVHVRPPACALKDER